ncbi:MAG: ATP-binding protein [Ignavibacteriaceae bacterium]|nr:ATP-binding protein [Ignavibacteriaceae bacterium]
MLKSFSVGNFRSIKETCTLDFTRSGRKKSDISNYASVGGSELSLNSVIYGANASGKSNLIRAVKAFSALINYSAKFAPDEHIFAYEPYRLETGYDQKPVCFTIEFILNSIRYYYSIQFTAKSIVHEKLSYYPLKRETLIFDRNEKREIDFGDAFKGERKTIERLTLPNQLFLSKAAENNAEICIPVFNLLTEGITFLPSSVNSINQQMEQLVAEKFSNDPDSSFAKKLTTLMSSLDTGIRSFTIIEQPSGVSESLLYYAPAASAAQHISKPYKIKTVHIIHDTKNNSFSKVLFDIADESAGTRNLFTLAGIILLVLDKGNVVIIDEFEKNLHPLITTYLIRLFTNPVTNPKNAQLIFATHDITQLQEETFNRDQVWFTEKNERGETELIRCSDIKGLRLNAPLDKWYISGRLAGTAIINDTDFMIAMQKDAGE